jgi:hypothetical protein
MANKQETPKAKANTKFAGQRHNVRKRVVTMRTRKLMSWAAIAAELEVAPRTARRIFQEAKGEHTHHDHLPNKGGRFPTTATPADPALVVLPGDGTINEWVKVGTPAE